MKYRHISLLTMVILMLVKPTACVVKSYVSELQTVVNEPIYNRDSYFIS